MVAAPIKETYPASRFYIKDGYNTSTMTSDGYDIVFATTDSLQVKTSAIGQPTTDGYTWTLYTGINQLARAFSQGTPGNIVVVDASGTTKTIPGSLYPSGYIFMTQIQKVLDSGTSARGLIFYI
jgi:hypothetical protein